MNSLYTLSPSFLTCLVMITTILIILQIHCIFYQLIQWKQEKINFFHNYFEISILIYLFFVAYLFSKVSYESNIGFLIFNNYTFIRYFIWITLMITGTMTAIQEKKLFPFIIPSVTAFSLPFIQNIFSSVFPVCIIIVLTSLFIYISFSCFYKYQKQKNMLSILSIKEAIDTMNFGILFCEKDAPLDGRILLENLKIQELMYIMTHQFYYNGKTFYHDLCSGNISSSCKRIIFKDKIVYQLPDKTIWCFELHSITSNSNNWVLLIASDITEIWNTAQNVYEQNKGLEERNTELKNMLKNLNSICKTEEILRSKVRVHDILGQRISILLRTLQEHKKIDNEMIHSLENDLSDDFKNFTDTKNYSLTTLKKILKQINVTLSVSGELPDDPKLANVFYEIISEAATNAVRHGYASKVSVKLSETVNTYSLKITNNGIITSKQINENGGLKEMRRKINQLNGEFRYSFSPYFQIDIDITKGEPNV